METLSNSKAIEKYAKKNFLLPAVSFLTRDSGGDLALDKKARLAKPNSNSARAESFSTWLSWLGHYVTVKKGSWVLVLPQCGLKGAFLCKLQKGEKSL